MRLDSVSLAAVTNIFYFLSSIYTYTKIQDHAGTLLSLEAAQTRSLEAGGRFWVLNTREILRHIYF